MNVLIIEDELVAQQALVRSLTTNFDDIRIVGVLDSVDKSVSWLENCQSYPDVIFMDVELSDGICFEIFEKVKISANVIITTAYDNYAITAFKINSLDYLLKPIVEEELQRAWKRCVERIEAHHEKPPCGYHRLTLDRRPLAFRCRLVRK